MISVPKIFISFFHQSHYCIMISWIITFLNANLSTENFSKNDSVKVNLHMSIRAQWQYCSVPFLQWYQCLLFTHASDSVSTFTNPSDNACVQWSYFRYCLIVLVAMALFNITELTMLAIALDEEQRWENTKMGSWSMAEKKNWRIYDTIEIYWMLWSC